MKIDVDTMPICSPNCPHLEIEVHRLLVKDHTINVFACVYSEQCRYVTRQALREERQRDEQRQSETDDSDRKKS